MSLIIERLTDAINVVKDDGTKVNYYLFDEYEIHLNVIPPKTKQVWHFHQNIEETILITKGEIEVNYLENNQIKKEIIKKDELVLVKDSIHTFINNSDQDCHFVVFRLVLNNENKREIFKHDKQVVEID
ncbi:cupin domain-containing protein [Thomasclavelia sp.]|uniref:cupin domain-containing protein n=1 Tax=Thomasclavelia sp. TaxID=3025757 RepID=UPI0025CC3C34|nr:cupin domain-containing protein [Thomasclavelia sp.]